MSGTINPITHAWSPGVAAVGQKVNSLPEIFTQPVAFQDGLATGLIGASPPAVATPGTVASAGTVTNLTGFDVMAYISATTGIQKIAFPGVTGGTIAGTTPAAQTIPVYVPNNSQIAVTYTGTLTWLWLAI